MEKKLFDLLAAALTAITGLTAWGIWLEDRRKKRKDTATYLPHQSATNAAQGSTNIDVSKDIENMRQDIRGLQHDIENLRHDIQGLQHELDTEKRRMGKIGGAVKANRTKILEILEVLNKLSRNAF